MWLKCHLTSGSQLAPTIGPSRPKSSVWNSFKSEIFRISFYVLLRSAQFQIERLVTNKHKLCRITMVTPTQKFRTLFSGMINQILVNRREVLFEILPTKSIRQKTRNIGLQLKFKRNFFYIMETMLKICIEIIVVWKFEFGNHIRSNACFEHQVMFPNVCFQFT